MRGMADGAGEVKVGGTRRAVGEGDIIGVGGFAVLVGVASSVGATDVGVTKGEGDESHPIRSMTTTNPTRNADIRRLMGTRISDLKLPIVTSTSKSATHQASISHEVEHSRLTDGTSDGWRRGRGARAIGT